MSHHGSIRKAQIAVIPEIVLCDRHKEKVTIFCTNCHDLVCTECIVDKHNGHNFKRVKEIVNEKRQELKAKLINLETIKVPEIKKLLDDTRLKKSETETKRKDLTDSINIRADELVADVNKARNKLLEEVNRLHKQDNDKLTEREKILEELLIEKEEILAEYRKDLTTTNDVKIVKITLELDKQAVIKLDTLSTDMRFKKYIFVPGNLKSLCDVFGQCIEQGEDAGNVACLDRFVSGDDMIETKLELLSEFHHRNDKSEIKAITTTDNQAYIVTYDGTDVIRVNKMGQVHQTLTFTSQISDLALMDDGCLLVTPNGGSDGHKYQIKKVKRNGKISTFIDTKPLIPYCICTSPTGHLYVGFIDNGNYDVTDKNTRSVIKLSCDGKKLKKWQFDKSHKRIFTLPFKIQTNNKDMIWVRDRTADSRGRVVVLHDQEDGVRFIYNGVKNDQITRHFNPSDLTAAWDGTMMISDTNNHVIHGVDENGVLLYLLGSQYQTGLGSVTAICLNRNETALWVGNLKGHIQVLSFNRIYSRES